MIVRTPKLHPALRFVAAGCVVLWLLASSYCSVEHLLDFDHYGNSDGEGVTLKNAEGQFYVSTCSKS